MHPMFVKLFIETDADDLLAYEEEQRAARAGPGTVDRERP